MSVADATLTTAASTFIPPNKEESCLTTNLEKLPGNPAALFLAQVDTTRLLTFLWVILSAGCKELKMTDYIVEFIDFDEIIVLE